MATPGLVFRIGGVLDPSLKGALMESVAAAQASAKTVMAAAARSSFGADVSAASNTAMAGLAVARLKKEMEAIRVEMVRAQNNPLTPILIVDSLVKDYKDRQALLTSITAAASAERVAITRAEQVAEAEAILIGAGAGKGGGHGSGGIAGIIRESLVIMREISMGRGTGRIGGSITLLAQYLGVLDLAVKSTATEQVLAAAASKKLNVEMAAQAITAQRAAVTDVEKAAADKLLSASQAQAAVTAGVLKDEELALATATTTLNPIFFAIVGVIVAAGAATFILWRHFRQAAIEAKNLADALNPLKKKFTELAEAQDKAAKSAQENADWLDELLSKHTTESDALAEKIKLLHEEADARRKAAKDRGASAAELQAMDEAALKQEKEMLLAEQARLKVAQDKAEADELAASNADIAGATMKDAKGNVIDLGQAQDKVKRLGEIADRAQAASDASDQQKVIDQLKSGEIGPARGQTRASDINRRLRDLGNTKFEAGTKENPLSVTVAEAQANYNAAKADAQKLEADQAKLDDILKNKKSTLEEINAAYRKVADDIDDVNGRTATKDDVPDTEKSRGGKSDILGLTDRQRAGAQISGPAVALLDVNKRMEKHLASIDKKIGDGKKSPWGGKK